ncbi:MAG: inositol monophosphatase [Myxococcota bacterium]|nr:inositol monophosphatase [Myxococcota bacterium]
MHPPLQRPNAHRFDTIIRPILKSAGQEAMIRFRQIGSTEKADGSPVTEADRAAEAVLVAGISAAFPQDEVRSEEGSGQDGSQRCWYIDPIDGTSAFLEGLAYWGPTVGLVEGGTSRYGALWLPRTGDYFHCEDGVAFLNDVPLPPLVDVAPARRQVLYTPSRIHAHIRLDWPGKCRSLGSIAAHLCMVAAGSASAALIPSGWHAWDTAGGLALIQSVGAHAETLSGQPLDIERHAGQPFIAGLPSAIQWLRQPGRLSFLPLERSR